MPPCRPQVQTWLQLDLNQIGIHVAIHRIGNYAHQGYFLHSLLTVKLKISYRLTSLHWLLSFSLGVNNHVHISIGITIITDQETSNVTKQPAVPREPLVQHTSHIYVGVLYINDTLPVVIKHTSAIILIHARVVCLAIFIFRQPLRDESGKRALNVSCTLNFEFKKINTYFKKL